MCVWSGVERGQRHNVTRGRSKDTHKEDVDQMRRRLEPCTPPVLVQGVGGPHCDRILLTS